MDDKRTIDCSKVASDGCVICRSGKFAIVLTNNGDYQLIVESTGVILDHLSKEEVDDMYKCCMAAKRWNNHHNVVK